ncbi:SOSS complex subunit B family protein [Nanoarchaeota archaeon]
MFIKDLQPRQTNVEVEGEVTEMSDVREFDKFGKKGRVANAIIKDGTGTVKLSLWNEQIEKVKVGDTVKIEKGYVGEYQGELQLTTGKFGTMEVVEKEEGASTEAPAAPAEEPAAEPAAEPKPEPQPTAEPEPEKKPAPDEKLDVEEEDVF